jgi:hypothetical protein
VTPVEAQDSGLEGVESQGFKGLKGLKGGSPGKLLWRGVVAFGRFWWDFLIGDTPEIFVGVLAAAGLVALLRHDSAAALVALPAAVTVVLVASLARSRLRG